MGLELLKMKRGKFFRVGIIVFSLLCSFFLFNLKAAAGSQQTQVKLTIRATPSTPLKPQKNIVFFPEKVFFEEIYQSLREKLSRFLIF